MECSDCVCVTYTKRITNVLDRIAVTCSNIGKLKMKMFFKDLALNVVYPLNLALLLQQKKKIVHKIRNTLECLKVMRNSLQSETETQKPNICLSSDPKMKDEPLVTVSEISELGVDLYRCIM